MRSILTLTFLLGLFPSPALQAEENTVTTPVPTGFINKIDTTEDRNRRYVLYVPQDYSPDKAWPLIVFLHGAGERGDDGLIQTEVGIGTAIRRYSDRFPALVLFPQCPEDDYWSSVEDHMDDIMAQTRKDYTIDAHRIYLTGISLGGYGTWGWGAVKSDTFAALMPICGGGNPSDLNTYIKGRVPDVYSAKNLDNRIEKLIAMPIWAFHGGMDVVVPARRSDRMVSALKKGGGNPRLTVFRGVGHNSWDKAYADKKGIEWLFEQKRDTPAPE